MGTLWAFLATRLAGGTLSVFLGSVVSTAFGSPLEEICFALKRLGLGTFMVHLKSPRRGNPISALSCWTLDSFCFAWHYPEKVLRFLGITGLLIHLPQCPVAVITGVKEPTVLRGLWLLDQLPLAR